MNDETSDPDEMFGFLVEERRNRRDPEEHPSPETLTAYQANELSSEEDERIQSHLAICGHCTEMLLELEEFLHSPEVLAEPTAELEAADRPRLRDHLPQPAQKTTSRKPLPYLFAASLIGALTLSGLFSWRAIRLQRDVNELRGQVAELRQPIVNPQKISLRSVRGGETLELPADRPVRLNLETSVPKEYGKYIVQIMDSEDKPVSVSPLYKDENGKLTMILPKDSLTPGLYTFRLEGTHAGSSDALEDYLVRVTPHYSETQEK